MRREIEAVKRDGIDVEAILNKDYKIGFTISRKYILTIPKEFLFAPSVPGIARGIVPFWGGMWEASLVHDYAYYTRLFDNHHWGDGRTIADELFYRIMISAGVSWWNAQKTYRSVRLFGRKLYLNNNYKGDQVQLEIDRS